VMSEAKLNTNNRTFFFMMVEQFLDRCGEIKAHLSSMGDSYSLDLFSLPCE
jgi:hypothetical protein